MKKNKKMTINTKFALVWAIVVPLVLLNIFLHAKVNVLEETNSKDIYPRFIKLEREDYNNKREIFKLQWPELAKKSAELEQTLENNIIEASKNKQGGINTEHYVNFKKIQDIARRSENVFVNVPNVIVEIGTGNVSLSGDYIVIDKNGHRIKLTVVAEAILCDSLE